MPIRGFADGDHLKPRWTIAITFLTASIGAGASYRQRVSDSFRDTFKANVGIGIGIYAQVKATSFLDAGVGWGGYWLEAGFESRYTKFVHPSINGCPFPLALIPGCAFPDDSPIVVWRMANVHDTPRADTGDENAIVGQLFDARAIAKWDAYGPMKRSPHVIFQSSDPTYTEHPLGFEVGVGVLVVDIRVGFDPIEFFNLVATIFGRNSSRDSGQPEPGASSRPSG